MIAGIGTDILHIPRITHALEKTPKLAERILTPTELEQFQQNSHPDRFLAKCFAAKEAAVKALGTGIAEGISWQHLEISHNALGKPELTLFSTAKQRAQSMNISQLHLSYSDEQDYICAFVVAE